MTPGVIPFFVALVIVLAGGWSMCRIWDGLLGYKRVPEDEMHVPKGYVEGVIDNEVRSRSEIIAGRLREQALGMLDNAAQLYGTRDRAELLRRDPELRGRLERVAAWLNAIEEIKGFTNA